MNKVNGRNIKMVVILIVIIVLITGSTYAYYYFSTDNNTTDTTAGCFEVSYSGQEIDSASLVSTTDYTEGKSTTITLSKASGCDIYTTADIYIYTNATGTTAPISDPEALKYRVYNGETLLSEGTINKTGELQLVSGLELTTTKTNYTIWIWVDSDISLGAYNGEKYSGYIYATSSQTSTVVDSSSGS